MTSTLTGPLHDREAFAIEGLLIGAAHPCRFVAELSGNHNGNETTAYQLIGAAKAAGADFVKFQAFTPSELVALRGDGKAPAQWGAQGWTMRALYEKAQTPLEWLPRLFRYARSIGITPFASVFGQESMAALDACYCPAYKIARLDNHAGALIASAQLRGKPVIVSHSPTDGTILPLDVHALYCPPGYPTPVENIKLPKFTAAGYIGLSSHCLSSLLPVAAVARGCRLIEMHFQLEDEPSELEANISLTPVQFSRMVAAVRATERMLA